MKNSCMPLLVAGGADIAIGSFVTGSAVSVLPLPPILACPLMMIFMMGGSGGMHHGGDSSNRSDDAMSDRDHHERVDEPHRPEQRR